MTYTVIAATAFAGGLVVGAGIGVAQLHRAYRDGWSRGYTAGKRRALDNLQVQVSRRASK